MASDSQHGGECPYCGESPQHLNNHVRMKSGGPHGPQGQYPENWDKENRRIDETLSAESTQTDEDGSESAGESAGANDLLDSGGSHEQSSGDESDDATDPSDLFEDLADDAREYECGECGEPLPYLGGKDREDGGKECPECGERLFWSMIE